MHHNASLPGIEQELATEAGAQDPGQRGDEGTTAGR